MRNQKLGGSTNLVWIKFDNKGNIVEYGRKEPPPEAISFKKIELAIEYQKLIVRRYALRNRSPIALVPNSLH